MVAKNKESNIDNEKEKDGPNVFSTPTNNITLFFFFGIYQTKTLL